MSSQGQGKNKRKGRGRGNAGRGRGRGHDLPPTPGTTDRVGKPLEKSGITIEKKPDYLNPKDSSTADFDEKLAAGACGNDLLNDQKDTVRPEKSSTTASRATTTVEEHNQTGRSSVETPSKSRKIKGRQRDIPASSSDDKGGGN